MPWDTTVIIIFVNFAALSECSCIRVLSKLFIYNGAFTTAWFKDDLFPMKYDMLITNFVEIYFVTKWNWILKTEREKLNEENEMKLFQSTYSVLLCGVGTFDVSVHYQHEIDPWRKICLNKSWLSYTVLTRTGVWTKIYFVIESRYNCQSTLYHNDKTIYFATYLMC